MVRRLAVVIAVVTSLLIARGAAALPITPVDFDSWTGGSIVLSHTGLFTSVFDPTTTTGEISSDVLFDGLAYTYAHQATPHVDAYSLSDSARFRTAPVATRHHGPPGRRGLFTGVAGWSFSDALRAGGTGTAADFSIDFREDRNGGPLEFATTSPDPWWDAFEPIKFFYVTQPRNCARNPMAAEHCSVTLRKYYLTTTGDNDFSFSNRADSLAPVPEPGSIALLGSGLLGLYAEMRRRRRQKADPV